MAQRSDIRDMLDVYRAIEANPGQRPPAIGRLALPHRGRDNVYRILHRMDRVGFLLYEDDCGKLYPFKICGRALEIDDNRVAGGNESEYQKKILSVLHRECFGMYESELAQELGWNRRTLNNYLRILAKQDKIYKENHIWYAVKTS